MDIKEENRTIRKIKTAALGKENVGKWICSESIPAADGDPITRYLQADGTWGKSCHYFKDEKEVRTAIAVGCKPDFSLSDSDLHNRALMREFISMDWDVGWDVGWDYDEYDE